MNDLILYTTEDGRSQIKLRAKDQTGWLTQLEMAKFFDATKQNRSLHLDSVFQDGELYADSVIKDSLTTRMRWDHEATVKQSLTVQGEPGRAPTTEESSAVQKGCHE